ncbi:hypothetical protein N7452_010713 [Penicillium brevicompactum]|uniref:Uncharacterized protein n=1 Tax=Penicillium brevicompactum TaxID=5074 RepID=A0A9W9Q165_PENBR|nr:hypothetical protein N7452_010713 [Penicillium brevicompactum]
MSFVTSPIAEEAVSKLASTPQPEIGPDSAEKSSLSFLARYASANELWPIILLGLFTYIVIRLIMAGDRVLNHEIDRYIARNPAEESVEPSQNLEEEEPVESGHESEESVESGQE